MAKQLTCEQRREIWARDKYKCFYCGVDVITDTNGIHMPSNTATVDHLNPKFFGGTNDDDNLVTACFHCNCSKNVNTLEEYRIWQGRKTEPGRIKFSIEKLIDKYNLPLDLTLQQILDYYESITPQIVFWGERPTTENQEH